MRISGLLVSMVVSVLASSVVRGDLIISQYVETNSGTTPKGIELWNVSGATLDFSVRGLTVLKGINGASLSSDFTLNTGTLAADAVLVIGTSDIGTYLDTAFGAGVIAFTQKTFTFNGDDALAVQLAGITTDVFGVPGSDPGNAWSSNGVSTADQNISLRAGISSGSLGFTDPSLRFETVSVSPSAAGGLAGFGVAPSPTPEPGALVLLLVAVVGLGMRCRPRRNRSLDLARSGIQN